MAMAIFYRALPASSGLLEAPTAAFRERVQNIASVCWGSQRFFNELAVELVVEQR
jgi:hypothetical protein